MTDKFTPGPWRIDTAWGPSEEHPDWVAIITDNSITVSGHIGAARGRLIAAAPELLEGLRFFAQIRLDSNALPSDFADAVLKARAIIARATGDAQ